MFHLQSLELLHWDYCQRLTLPLDAWEPVRAGDTLTSDARAHLARRAQAKDGNAR